MEDINQNKTFEENRDYSFDFDNIFSQNFQTDLKFETAQDFVPASSDFKLVSALFRLGLSQETINRISLYNTGEKMNEIIYNNFRSAKSDDSCDMTNISYVDFKLASIAATLSHSVISFDGHLLCDLPKIIEFDSIWPQDINVLDRTGPFLLDANILLSLDSESMTDHKRETIAMFNTKGIHFILLLDIVKEIKDILKKRQLAKRFEKKLQKQAEKRFQHLGEEEFEQKTREYIEKQYKFTRKRSNNYRSGFNIVYRY